MEHEKKSNSERTRPLRGEYAKKIGEILFQIHLYLYILHQIAMSAISNGGGEGKALADAPVKNASFFLRAPQDVFPKS